MSTARASSNVNHARARRIAEWQVTIGQVALAANLVARLTTVYLQLVGGPIDPVRFTLATGKGLLLIVMLALYRRQLWPSHFMLAVFPIGFLYAVFWLHVSASIAAVGVVMGVSLFLGAHGMRSLRRLREAEGPLAAAT